MENCKKTAKGIGSTGKAENGWKDVEDLLAGLHVPDVLKNRNRECNIVLFGAGIYGEIALDCLRESNISVRCFCDNDIGKQGKMVRGIPVISPKELASLDKPAVIITARHKAREIAGQLAQMDVECISFDAYFVWLMKDSYRRAYFDVYTEPRSGEVLIAILKSMISGSKSYCSAVMEDNAFFALPEVKYTGNEIYVDAGAYVGDTVERFIWNNAGIFRKVYAFEPGKRQYNAMQVRINRLAEEWGIDRDRFVCINGGLGEEDAVVPFAQNIAAPTGSSFITCDDSGEQVNIYSLDSFLNQAEVTMIKADIEGFELEMLRGARNIIRRYRPRLAISVYHKPQDLYLIPRYISSLVPGYKMALRHHSPGLLETVLYCWTE